MLVVGILHGLKKFSLNIAHSICAKCTTVQKDGHMVNTAGFMDVSVAIGETSRNSNVLHVDVCANKNGTGQP